MIALLLQAVGDCVEIPVGDHLVDAPRGLMVLVDGMEAEFVASPGDRAHEKGRDAAEDEGSADSYGARHDELQENLGPDCWAFVSQCVEVRHTLFRVRRQRPYRSPATRK